MFRYLRNKAMAARSQLNPGVNSTQASLKERVPRNGDRPEHDDPVDANGDADFKKSCEPVDRYEQGRYYPAFVGEVLVERYRIEHKLGWGSFSTVWMAHDSQERMDVALKIMSPGEAGEDEYQKQSEILRTVSDSSHLVTYRGTFLLPGNGGDRHRVLVLPLLSPSLGSRAGQLPVATRLSAAKQLLVALKGLHEVGLVHRGMRRPANLVLALGPLEFPV